MAAQGLVLRPATVPFGEIAGVLGMNPSTVRVRLHRARARLRDQLDLPGRDGDQATAVTG